MDDGLFWMLILGGILLTLVVGFATLRNLRAARPKVTKETRQQPGAVTLPEGHHHGPQLDYTADYTPATTGRHATPASLVVTIDLPLPGDFTLLPITGFDRYCTRIGLAKAVRTGDSSFDNTYYIQTDSPDFCRAYFGDSARRQAVRRVFEMGFNRLDANGTKLVATWQPYPDSAEESEGHGRAAAEALVPLTHKIPPQPSTLMRRMRRPLSRRRLQWVSFTTLGLGIGLSIWLWTALSANAAALDHWGLILATLPFVGLALFLFLLWGYWLVRGHSTSHLQMRSLVLLGIVVFPLAGILLVEHLNASLDTSPQVERLEPVADTSVSRGKNSTTYYASITWWHDPTRKVRLAVDSVTFNRIAAKRSHLLLHTRAGWYGFEWIEKFEVRNP